MGDTAQLHHIGEGYHLQATQAAAAAAKTPPRSPASVPAAA